VLWDELDDDMLLRLIRDYAWNWRLIADLFNSARSTISIDKRSAWDCYHRWDQKWGPTSKATAAANAQTQAEPLLTPAQQEFQQARAQAQAIAMANHTQTGGTGPPPVPALPVNAIPNTTPVPASAVPTSAVATSVTGAADESVDMNGVTSPGAARREAKLQREARYQGSKRKVRNNTMRDAIRRSQKRRDINRKNNRESGPALIFSYICLSEIRDTQSGRSLTGSRWSMSMRAIAVSCRNEESRCQHRKN